MVPCMRSGVHMFAHHAVRRRTQESYHHAHTCMHIMPCTEVCENILQCARVFAHHAKQRGAHHFASAPTVRNTKDRNSASRFTRQTTSARQTCSPRGRSPRRTQSTPRTPKKSCTSCTPWPSLVTILELNADTPGSLMGADVDVQNVAHLLLECAPSVLAIIPVFDCLPQFLHFVC